MSSFEQTQKQWTAGLKQPDPAATLNQIRDYMRRPGKDTNQYAYHIFSKVVLPVYCSPNDGVDGQALLEMLTYLWTFALDGRYKLKHFMGQLYSSIRCMPATKATCSRIKSLTPLFGTQSQDPTEDYLIHTNINSIIFYMFYTAKEPMGQGLSAVLFKNATDALKHQRSISLSSFLDAFAAWFEKKTQTMSVMLTVDLEGSQKLLESLGPLFVTRGEDMSTQFRDQFWSMVHMLVRFEAKFKGADLVQPIIDGVKKGGLFDNDHTMAATTTLFYEILRFKKLALSDKSFTQLTKALIEFLKKSNQAEFPTSAVTLSVVQLYEKLQKTDPPVSESVGSEFTTAIDGLMRWIDEKLTSDVKTEATPQICKSCNQNKGHILLQLAAIALTPIQQHFRNQTIAKKTFDSFLSITKMNVATMDRSRCELTERLKNFWLKMWCFLANAYKPSQRQMSAQFVELFELVQAKRHTYAPNTVTDVALLRSFGLVFNADACIDVPVDDPMWSNTIDLLCTEAVVQERKYAPRTLVTLMALQKKNPHFKDLNLHQLISRPGLRDFGVDNVRERMDRFALIELQSRVIYQHCHDQSPMLVDLFDYVWQDRPENASKLAKLIQYFDEAQFKRLPPERVERLKQMCAGKPLAHADDDAFKVSLSLGYLNYNLYVIGQDVVQKAGRAANPTDKAVLQKELLPFIDQINMDNECKLLRLLDDALVYFTAMARLLSADGGLLESVVSPSKLMRCLDNLSMFYQLRYVEDKAMQAKCLVYVVAKRRAHLNAQLSCIGMFIDNPRLYEAVVATALGFKMPRTVRVFLDANKELTDLVHQPQPDLSKTTLTVELAMKLAVYYAATGANERVERLVMCGRDSIQRYENNAEAKSYVWYMKVHFYHALYLITFKHRMQWLVSLHAGTHLLLAMFKNMSDAPTHDYLTQASVFMQKMIPELLEFVATQKCMTDANDAFLNMLIKYAIRQGYGLRAAQLFALSSKLALDREGMEECEVKLAYVDKVLMFYTNANLSEKSNYPELVPVPIQTSPLIDDVFTQMEQVRRDSGAPNGREFMSPIHGNAKQQPLRQMIADHQPQRRLSKYIIDHPDTCDCGFCRYPQFRLVSFQTGCIYTRLLHMTGAHEISAKLYAKYYKCWSAIREQVQTHRIVSATLAEAFGQFSSQFMLNYSNTLVQSVKLDEAGSKLDTALRIYRSDVNEGNEGFLQELACQSENIKLMEITDDFDKNPTFVAQRYEDYVKRTRQFKTPAKSQALPKALSKSTVKKAPNRESFNFLIATELGTSSQVTANDIFNDASVGSSKKRVVSKTPKAAAAKTPVTALKKKLDVAKSSPPVSICKLLKTGLHAETVKKLHFADEAKTSNTPIKTTVTKTAKAGLTTAKTPVTALRKKVAPAKPSSPVSTSKLMNAKMNGETAIKQHIADEAKVSNTPNRRTAAKTPKAGQLIDTSNSTKLSPKPSSPVTMRKLKRETAKRLQFADDCNTPIKPTVTKTPKTAPHKSLIAMALERKRLELERKDNNVSSPKTPPTDRCSDDEVIEASPEIVAKTPRLRAAQLKAKTPIPIIVLDDSTDDTKENKKPAVVRKLRTTKDAKVTEDTPKRQKSARRK